MKKMLNIFLAFTFIFMLNLTANAQDNNAKVQLNGENISFNLSCKNINGTMYVPAKEFAEKFGLKVSFDTATNSFVASNDTTNIVLKNNTNAMGVTKNNKTTDVNLASAPQIIDGHFYAPVRFISDSLDSVQVGWDDAEKTVVIIDYKTYINDLKTKAPLFYEYLSDEYKTFDASKLNMNFSFDFKISPNEGSLDEFSASMGNMNVGADLKMEAITSGTDGTFDANFISKGMLKEMMASFYPEVKNLDTISVSGVFNNDSLYIKSDLFDKLPELAMLKGKWVKLDVKDLEIPNVNTMQELLSGSSTNVTADQMLIDTIKSINEGMLDIYTYEDTKLGLDFISTVFDNNHFKVKVDGTTKVYTLNLTTKDYSNMMDKFSNLMGSTDAEKTEMQEMIKNINLDCSLEVIIKDSIVTDSNISYKFIIKDPNMGTIQVLMNGKSTCTEIPKADVKPVIPQAKDTIDFKSLLEM